MATGLGGRSPGPAGDRREHPTSGLGGLWGEGEASLVLGQAEGCHKGRLNRDPAGSNALAPLSPPGTSPDPLPPPAKELESGTFSG
jgi:hypothetical protein